MRTYTSPVEYSVLVRVKRAGDRLELSLTSEQILPLKAGEDLFPGGEVDINRLWRELAYIREHEDFRRYDFFCEILIQLLEEYV